MKHTESITTDLTTLLLAQLASVHAADTEPPQWNLEALSKVPATVETPLARVEGVQSLFMDGLDYKGEQTKFYAYLGFPANFTGKVPAVVLVHGGGGTAFADWVKYWNAKGYAALAFDTEGQVPVKTTDPQPRWQTIESLNLPFTGAPQRPAEAFGDLESPFEEQWFYHGVAECLLSVSFLASRPEVDPNLIGSVGISMGSMLCSIAASIDDRLAFVVPQYIGGNLKLGNVWYNYTQSHPETYILDPVHWYANAKTRAQWAWINGINDKYGLPPMTTASFKITSPKSQMTILPTLGHSHHWSETGPNAVREIYAFADSVTCGAPPLARVLSTMRGKGDVTLTWTAQNPVIRAQLSYTIDPIPRITVAGEARKDWENVKYTVQDIALPTVTSNPNGTQQATFPLPPGLTAGVINLIDDRGLSVSSEFLDYSF